MTYLMNPATGSVATLAEWEDDYRTCSPEEWGGEEFEDAGLVEVVPNTPDATGYDDNYGEWRPA